MESSAPLQLHELAAKRRLQSTVDCYCMQLIFTNHSLRPFDIEFVDASDGASAKHRVCRAQFPDLPRIVNEAGMLAPSPLVRRLRLQFKVDES